MIGRIVEFLVPGLVVTKAEHLKALRDSNQSIRGELAAIAASNETLLEETDALRRRPDELEALLSRHEDFFTEIRPPGTQIPLDNIAWPESVPGDPTRTVIGSEKSIYSLERADLVYGEAFRKCFDYLMGAGVTGDILEFGTYRGYSARLIAGLMNDVGWGGKLLLFDSFEGFPGLESAVDRESYEVAVNNVWYPGQARPEPRIDEAIRLVLEQIIPPDRLEIVKGFYSDTLETSLNDITAAMVSIDCDLYESTLCVLNHLLAEDIFQDGSVLLFDDFNSNRANPKLGERRALDDAFSFQHRYGYSQFFTYGWHGVAFFVHDLSLEFGKER